jgi:WD40 repeat protein
LDERTVIAFFEPEDHQPGLEFSPDGKLVATGGYGHQAKIWSVSRGRLLRSLHIGATIGGLTVRFSPDGTMLAVGNRNADTKIFEVSSGNVRLTLDKKMSQDLRFHPNGKTLAVTYVDASIGIWNVVDGKLLHIVKTPASELYTVDWSPDGDVLATAGRDAKITLWNAKDLSILKELEAPDWVISVRFCPDGRRLFSAGGSQKDAKQRKVQVWGLR